MNKSQLNDNMIKRIKKKRKEKGYSQEKMAELLDISYSNYSKIENSIVTPTLERLIDIAQLLGVSLDYLVYGQESDNDVKYYSNDKQNEAIASLLKNCDRENLQHIIHFLEKIYSLL